MRQWFHKLICLCFAVTILVQTIIPCAACCCQHHDHDEHPLHRETTHACHHHDQADPIVEPAHQIPDSHCPFCVCGVKRNLVLTPNKIHRLENPNSFCPTSLIILSDQPLDITMHQGWQKTDTLIRQPSIVTALGRQLI
ncbi:hypothetical protein [Gimesia sp.]|uniref:hypothetical protein n=1 Tax=Gimesia sp. TaxID=2024833 RepID=UPI003A926D6B